MSTQVEPPAAPDPPAPIRRTTNGWAVVGVIVAVVAAVTIGALVLTGGDDDPAPADAGQRIAATQSACQEWLDGDSTDGAAAPPTGWCEDMGRWLSDRAASGSMMGSMMWGSPEAMIENCQDWAATTQGASASEWCGQMATWMSQHMDGWNDSQDWDDHMGDGHWDDGMMRP